MHRLVDRLTPDQLHEIHALTMRLVHDAVADADDGWPLAWFGSITTERDDNAERAEEILREGYGLEA
jgi:hypothetical protein